MLEKPYLPSTQNIFRGQMSLLPPSRIKKTFVTDWKFNMTHQYHFRCPDRKGESSQYRNLSCVCSLPWDLYIGLIQFHNLFGRNPEPVEINGNLTASVPSLRYGDGTQGYCKRNLGYTCTLINRCRAPLQRLPHLVVSETAPVHVAQLIKCFGVWKVKDLHKSMYFYWVIQPKLHACIQSLESGKICVGSFLNSLIMTVLIAWYIWDALTKQITILFPYVKNPIITWASSYSASRCALPRSCALRFDRLR